MSIYKHTQVFTGACNSSYNCSYVLLTSTLYIGMLVELQTAKELLTGKDYEITMLTELKKVHLSEIDKLNEVAKIKIIDTITACKQLQS